MANPLILVVVVFLTIAGIAGLVIYMLLPARQKILNDEAAENDSRISSQWAGGADSGNVVNLDGTHHIGHHDGGGGPLH